MPDLTDQEILDRFKAAGAQPADDISDEDILQRMNAPGVVTETASTPQDEAVDTLRVKEAEAIEPTVEPLRLLKETANGLYTTQAGKNQQRREFVDNLKQAGINADFALDPDFAPKVDADAAVATKKFLDSMSIGGVPWSDLQGEDVDEAKGRILNAFTVATIAKNAPVVGRTARKVYGNMVRQKLSQRMQQILDQAQESGGTITSGAAGTAVQPSSDTNEIQQLSALFQVATRADDDTLFKVVQFGMMLDPTDPVSATEQLRQTIPSDVKAFAEAPFFRFFAESVNRGQIKAEAAQIRGGENDLGLPPSSKRGQDVAASVVAILGDGWTDILRQGMRDARTQHNLGKLGINFEGGGVPGYSDDGQVFVSAVAGDAFDILKKQSAAVLQSPETKRLSRSEKTVIDDLIKSDKAIEVILDEADQFGTDGRRKMSRAIIEESVSQQARIRSRADAFGVEEVEPGLTPTEKAYMGTWNEAFFSLMGDSERYFQSLSTNLKRQDIETNRGFEDLTGTALDKNFNYMLTNSEDLTDASEGFFEAFVASSAINRDRGEFMGGIRRWAEVGVALTQADPGNKVSQNPFLESLLAEQAESVGKFAGGDPSVPFDFGNMRVSVLHNHPMFKGLSKDAALALLREDVDVQKIYAQDVAKGAKERDKIMQRLMKWQRNQREGKDQKQGWLAHQTDLVKIGGHMLGDMAREIGRIVTENPEEGAAMMMIELPAGIGANAALRFSVQKADLIAGRALGSLTGSTVRGKALSQMYHASKVGQAFNRLSISNPVMSRRLHTMLKDMHAKEVKAGDIEGHADALAAASTAAKRAADETDLIGAASNANIKDMSKKVADVWDKLTADPGDFQNYVEHIEAATRGGVFKGIVADGKRVFGIGGKAHIRDQVFDPKSFDEALEGLDQMISGGSELEQSLINMEKIAEQSGRSLSELTAEEVQEALPSQINDVIGMVEQAQKIPFTNLFRDRLRDGLTRLRGAKAAETLPFFKASVEDAVSLVATRAMDSGISKSGWHLARKRLDRTMGHLLERRRSEVDLAEQELVDQAGALVNDESFDANLQQLSVAHDKKMKLLKGQIKALDDLVRRVSEHDPDLAFDGRQLEPMTLLSNNDIESLITEAPELYDLTPDDVLTFKVVGKGKKKQIDRINTRMANKEKAIAKAKGKDIPPAKAEKLREELRVLQEKANVLKSGRRERTGLDREAFFESLAHSGLTEDGAARKASLVDARKAVATSQQQGLGSNPFLSSALPLRQQMKWVKQGINALAGKQHNGVARMRLYMQQRSLMAPDELQVMDQIMRDVKGTGLSMAQVRKRVAPLTNKYPGLKAIFDDPANTSLVRDFAMGVDENLGTLYSMMEAMGVDKGVIEAWRKKGFDPNLYGIYERAKLIKGPQADQLLKTPDKATAPTEPLITATGQSLRFQRRFRDWRVVIDEPNRRVEFNFPAEGTSKRMPAAARDFLRRRYGKALKFRSDVDRGVDIANFDATGDIIRVGKPLGDVGVAVLDPIGGKTERLLVGISRAYGDIGAQTLFEALNASGNLVVDADTFRKQVSRYGQRLNKVYQPIPDNKTLFGNAAGKFVHRKVLADINKASRAYNNLDSVLQGMREVIHRSGADSGIFDQILAKTPGFFGKAVESLTGVFKQNLILLNPRVWNGNFIFNVVLDAASGADMFGSFEGWRSYMWAWKQRLRGQIGDSLPIKLSQRRSGDPLTTAQLARDQIAQEAIEGGILDGFFEASGGPTAEGRMVSRMLGFEDLTKMHERLGNRRGLLAKLEKQTTKNPDDKSTIINLHKDISAIEIQLEELQRGWFKNVGRNMTAMLGDQGLLKRVAQDTLGRRGGEAQRRVWDFLRDTYNNIDAAYKLGTYHHLRTNKGFGKEEALRHIKRFAQNYRDIPQALRPTGGKGAFLSLVTSFPYEAARIFGNLSVHQPGRFAAVIGMIPMMNMSMMTQAGINKEEFFALLETRGLKTKTDALLSLTDTLYVPGPGNSIATSIDLGLVQPWSNLVTNDFNPIARIAENITGADDEIDMISQIPARFVGNFVLNNPLFGGTVSTVGGFDEDTGAPLWDDRMSADQKAVEVSRMFVKSIVPAWVPGSRASYDFESADNAPINPRTGRPFGAQQKGTVTSRAAGFAVKGRGANTAGRILRPFSGTQMISDPTFDQPVTDFANSENVLVSIMRQVSDDPAGRQRPKNFPVFSKDQEVREWMMRKMQSDDPDVRAEAQREIDKIIETNYETFWKPLGRTRDVTDRERQKLEQYISNYTVEAQMNRLEVHQQTGAIIMMDKLGDMFSDRRIADMIQQIKFSPLGDVKIAGDPGKVQQSIEALDGYIKSNPAHNARLEPLLKWLVGTVKPKSEHRRRREMRRDQFRDKRERVADRVRFEP